MKLLSKILLLSRPQATSAAALYCGAGEVSGRSARRPKVRVRFGLTYQVSWMNRPRFWLLYCAGIDPGEVSARYA